MTSTTTELETADGRHAEKIRRAATLAAALEGHLDATFDQMAEDARRRLTDDLR